MYSSPPPPPVAALLDAVAIEVRRKLTNKHSLTSPFTPPDLLRFLRAYARAGHFTDATAHMLDAVASHTVHRIRSRHLNAISRPADLAALLAAYAELAHSSVAVPELIAAVGEQVCRSAAQQQERLCGAAPPAGARGGRRPGTEDAGAFCLRDMLSLVDSCARLGYRPSEEVMRALHPTICRQLAGAAPRDVAGLLCVLAGVGHRPGPLTLGLMLAALEDGGDLAALAAGREAAALLVTS